MNKTIKSKIIHKHDSATNWSQNTNVPVQGELIIYDADVNYPYERLKIGDGVKTADKLPFINDSKLDKTAYMSIDSGGYFRTYSISNGVKNTNSYTRLRGDAIEVYYNTNTYKSKTVYAAGGPEMRRTELDAQGNTVKEYYTRYRRDYIEGIRQDGSFFTIHIPVEETIVGDTFATQYWVSDNFASSDSLDNLSQQFDKFQKRTGDWYNAETMASGIKLSIGRMYVCTGPNVRLLDSFGNALYDTNGEEITPDGAKVVAVIMPNQLSYPTGNNSYAAYRCKAIWGSNNILGANFEAKDFLLESYDTGVKVVAGGGTSIWSM